MDLPKEFEINCNVLHLFHAIRLRDLSGDKDHIRGHENKGKDFPCGVAVSPSNFIYFFFFFALTSMSSRDFPFFVRDDQRFVEIVFRKG